MTPTFLVSFPTVTLGVRDIWPDGDAPENPTAADVLAVMKEEGEWRITHDWNILRGVSVDAEHWDWWS